MKPFTPELTKLPKRTVLTLTVVGNPNRAKEAIPALYGTAYGTKFKVFKPKGKKMEITWLSAFWPDAHRKPKSKWTGVWNLEISPFVRSSDLLQKNPALPVKLATLAAGTHAQILYIGPYSTERPTIRKLHDFVKEKGWKLAGPHEEVYLSRPGPKAKTLIRYRVTKQ